MPMPPLTVRHLREAVSICFDLDCGDPLPCGGREVTGGGACSSRQCAGPYRRCSSGGRPSRSPCCAHTEADPKGYRTGDARPDHCCDGPVSRLAVGDTGSEDSGVERRDHLVAGGSQRSGGSVGRGRKSKKSKKSRKLRKCRKLGSLGSQGSLRGKGSRNAVGGAVVMHPVARASWSGCVFGAT